LFAVALVALSFIVNPALGAKPTGVSALHQGQGKHSGMKYHSVKDYHKHYGKKASFGWYYAGKHHRHWSYQCYWPRYGCRCYWCPSTCCWYYWCEPRGCYYPVSYVEYATPTAAPQIVVNNTAVATTQGPATSDLPPAPPGGAGPVQPYQGGMR
jgi:hypothetical protein